MLHDPFPDLPDDEFPRMTGRGEGEGPLIDLPHRANQLAIRCLSCGREGQISGRRITVKFTQHLRGSIGRFVSALRCSGCGGRRLLVRTANDPNADGFGKELENDARLQWCRRLNTWLAEIGQDVFGYLDVLRDCPAGPDLAAAGILPHGS
ncbi:hypothetical protein [Brevundimonas sp. NIBR11]|uniref:hypothetical protein n=1 Tax=Brevundimonas sp. NIBR11 TaxID=3015999 RepID=UPI0022EFE213|nr:hypothetical protein [Brevundimonas sp. NIBR11]WGM31532.1 hypothetical protein KKHFBJBL_01779 [Brevundimonas sp. NIBR11]